MIPIKCVTCGKVIADMYRTYVEECRKRKLDKGVPLDKLQYFTSGHAEKTVEGLVLDELHITKMCCRRHFLTHVEPL